MPFNLGLCNKCRARVPAEFFTRDGQTWIRKDCPTCGPNEALVSSDAAVWQAKRDLWQYVPTDPKACTLNCEGCRVDHKPNMVFLDVTNHCNLHCPICIATIRSMGFDFHPPLEYFDRIFTELGRWNPRPVVQFFGGEPTLRQDLLELVALAKNNGLKPHIVTNGVRLADEEFCKKLCEARVPLRFAFDGRSADIYERMRNNRALYDKKMKALQNLKEFSKRKHAIIATAAWGINDQHIGDLFQFVHENRDLISDLGIIPLTENWEPGTFTAATTTTMEDVEKMVQQAIPGGEVDFVPAGLAHSMKKPRSFFRKNPRSEVLLFAGVHPNCESMTLLISDGQRYRGINYYLKKPFRELVVEFVALSKAIEPKLDRLSPDKFFQRQRGRLLCLWTFLPTLLRSIHFNRLSDGKPVRAILKLIALLFRRQNPEGLASGRRPRQLLRVAVLPFEEEHSVDAARMESCKAAFAYEDVDEGKVKTIPACLWYPYRNAILEKISGKYGVVPMRAEVEGPDGA
jgi:uncharacterized radical SAM superfamily Fe-S cluster-containing enzyme